MLAVCTVSHLRSQVKRVEGKPLLPLLADLAKVLKQQVRPVEVCNLKVQVPLMPSSGQFGSVM